MVYLCRERYRLELHWESIEYNSDSTAVLKGARFSGPVISNALKLEAPDYIDLDLTPQLFTLFDSYYIVRMSWDSVSYSNDGIIQLGGARLTNDALKSLHKFAAGDSIVINTEKHEEAVHAFNLLYESLVVRSDKKPYKYKG